MGGGCVNGAASPQTRTNNVSVSAFLLMFMLRQRRVLIRATSVPSLIWSRLLLGSRSKPGLKAAAWA